MKSDGDTSIALQSYVSAWDQSKNLKDDYSCFSIHIGITKTTTF